MFYDLLDVQYTFLKQYTMKQIQNILFLASECTTLLICYASVWQILGQNQLDTMNEHRFLQKWNKSSQFHHKQYCGMLLLHCYTISWFTVWLLVTLYFANKHGLWYQVWTSISFSEWVSDSKEYISLTHACTKI